MNKRGSGGGEGEGGHGAASGASSGHRRKRGSEGGEAEGKLRIHLKRSCTDKRVAHQGGADLGLTTDGEQRHVPTMLPLYCL